MAQVRDGRLNQSRENRDGKWTLQFEWPLSLKNVSLNFITYLLINYVLNLTYKIVRFRVTCKRFSNLTCP